MSGNTRYNYVEYYVKTLIKWTILSVTVGILGGLLGDMLLVYSNIEICLIFCKK